MTELLEDAIRAGVARGMDDAPVVPDLAERVRALPPPQRRWKLPVAAAAAVVALVVRARRRVAAAAMLKACGRLRGWRITTGRFRRT